jgi:ATP-binding cassette subfamily B multidrug efflux pump
MSATRPGGPGLGGGPGRGGPMAGLMVVPEKSKDFGGTLRRLAGRLQREQVSLVGVLGMAVVSVSLAVLGPKLLGNATTMIFAGVVGQQLPSGLTQQQAEDALRAAGQGQLADLISGMTVVPGSGVDFGALARLLALVAVVYVVSSLFLWGQGYVMAGVTQRTVFALRQDVEQKLGRLPLRYFDTHARGDLLSRVTNDIDNISTTLQQVLTQLVTSVLTVVGVLVMMFWISPLLAVISLLVVPLSLVLTLLIARRSRRHFVAQWEWTGRLNGHVEEMYTGHDLVQVFGHRQRAVADFDQLNEQMYQSSYRAQFISGIIQPTMAFVGNLNYVAICVIGGLQVASGSMPLGDVQAFIQYSRQFTMPITQIASVVNLMQSGVASAERVFELLDAEEEEPDPAHARLVPEPSGRIDLTAVSFRYEEQTPLIEDLHLRVSPGDTVAIVGPTGAGKTTLVNLLMRFYEIDAGTIELDGVDTRSMSRDSLRHTFGMVLQDTWLFGGTIRENIAYGADGATDAQIRDAARAANVEHFVHTLPDGYDTVLDDEASNLSAGEKQLLTIARAFLADPAILILDEATSSVDTRTEVLIQRALARLRAGRTSFVIAHRLSTIRDANTIVVMDHGRIVEQGTHAELIARGGVYYDLYESQFLEPAVEATAAVPAPG